MSVRRNFTPTIERLLQHLCTHEADALCIQTGDRPRMYVNGKSCVIASIEESLAEEDVLAVTACVIPEPSMKNLDPAGKTSHTFDYRYRDNQLIRFDIEAERARDGLRVVIWRRGDGSVSESV